MFGVFFPPHKQPNMHDYLRHKSTSRWVTTCQVTICRREIGCHTNALRYNTLKNAFNIAFANSQVHYCTLVFFQQYDKINKNYRSFPDVGVYVKRPVIMTSNISEWQSKITNISLSIRVPGQGVGLTLANSSVSHIPGYLAASGAQWPNPEHAFHRAPACDTDFGVDMMDSQAQGGVSKTLMSS